MRLLIATPLYPPEIGGPATYAKALEAGLPQEGVDVAVVKFADVRHLPKVIRHIAYYRRVLKAARTADVVLALDPVSTGLPAMVAARKAGKSFVVKIVGDYAWEQGRQRFGIIADLDEFVKMEDVPSRVRVLRKIQTRVAAAATRVIVPSEYLKKIVMTWGIPAEKIEVIYNAVPMDELAGKVPDAVSKLSPPLVVTAGRLVPWKNMEGVIDAVAALRTQGIHASLAIIGDGPELVRLERAAAQKLSSGYVLTGALAHPDALVVMGAADVFVLNSSYEGLSHFLIESLTLGVPTVARRIGGNPELITNGENGVLIQDNPNALAVALSHTLGDSSLRQNLSAAAKKSSLRFSESAMLSATAKLLSSLRNPT